MYWPTSDRRNTEGYWTKLLVESRIAKFLSFTGRLPTIQFVLFRPKVIGQAYY